MKKKEENAYHDLVKSNRQNIGKHEKELNVNYPDMSAAQAKAESVAEAFVMNDVLNTDPNGSYTGVTEHPGQKPEQDADDL